MVAVEPVEFMGQGKDFGFYSERDGKPFKGFARNGGTI